MNEIAIIVIQGQVKEADSHFHIALECQKRGLDVKIVDIGGHDVDILDYNENFSADRFSQFFQNADRSILRSRWEAASLLRVDPPLSQFNYSLIDRMFVREGQFNDISGVLVAQKKSFLRENYNQDNDYFLVESPNQLYDMPAEWNDFVLKPIVGLGGQGVARYQRKHLNEVAEKIRHCCQSVEGCTFLAMRFLPEIIHGERRTFVLEGRAVGSMLKTPKEGHWLANQQQGATTVALPLTDLDDEIARMTAERLADHGIRFYAVDTVLSEGRSVVIEINVSNPGGISIVDESGNGSVASNLARRVSEGALPASF